jgi:hypothetical protein
MATSLCALVANMSRLSTIWGRSVSVPLTHSTRWRGLSAFGIQLKQAMILASGNVAWGNVAWGNVN